MRYLLPIFAVSIAIVLLGSLGTERDARAGAPAGVMEFAPAYNMYTCPAPYTADYCVPYNVAFTVAGSVTDAGPGYIGFQTEIGYGSLHYNAAAMADLEIVWPDASSLQLRSPAPPTGDEGLVNHSSSTSVIPPYPTSTYAGSIVQISLMCDDSGADNVINLVPLDGGNTDGSGFIIDSTTTVPVAADSITVRCISPDLQPGVDTDGDGCTDAQEMSFMEDFGGDRNFLNRWDFYDVWSNTSSSYWDHNATIDLFKRHLSCRLSLWR